jgi:hypothetical protein
MEMLQWSENRRRTLVPGGALALEPLKRKRKRCWCTIEEVSRRGEAAEARRRVLVYHRRSVQEREAAKARRRAIKEMKEAEAVEAMYKLKDSTVPSSA